MPAGHGRIDRPAVHGADRENGYVSSFGSYHRTPRETYRFVITATPEGTDRKLVLRYQDNGRRR